MRRAAQQWWRLLTRLLTFPCPGFPCSHVARAQGYAAVVEVQSDPRISGLLRGTPVNGSTLIPTFAVTPQQDTSANFTLAVTVSSPSGAFPPFTTPLQISFCAPGYFLNSTDFLCYICPIGSW